MKILIVGSGGREHSLIWKISQSPLVTKLYCAPGNAGTEAHGENVPIPVAQIPDLVRFAKEQEVDLTVVGPELPLTLGIVDEFRSNGLTCFGPCKEAARLEGSKEFAKEFMKRHQIPTAEFEVVNSRAEAEVAVDRFGIPVVLKVDGLAAGKGVVVCTSQEDVDQALAKIFDDNSFGSAGERVVVEACLEGEEVSYIGVCDGERFLSFASSQDHKRLLDGDQGPNTGGMGAYSPAPVMTPELEKQVQKEITDKVLQGMQAEGIEFRGVLYVGLMITDEGPKVLEFNVRFGDPEAQPLLARLKSDLVPVLQQGAAGSLENIKLEWDERPAACIVLAAAGYPISAQKGAPIQGLKAAGELEGVTIFHAGTISKDGDTIVNGGRVLGVTALGGDLSSALSQAYRSVELIDWSGAQFRKDIGRRGVNR
ncbi:phosphoribosylamine--glycine ligase [Bdellovibrionota bacterium]